MKYGYPALTEAAKRKILGLNSARLYKLPGAAQGHTEGKEHGLYKPLPSNFESLSPGSLKTLLELGQAPAACVVSDNFSRMREEYLATGGERTNTRYGWIRTAA